MFEILEERLIFLFFFMIFGICGKTIYAWASIIAFLVFIYRGISLGDLLRFRGNLG